MPIAASRPRLHDSSPDDSGKALIALSLEDLEPAVIDRQLADSYAGPWEALELLVDKDGDVMATSVHRLSATDLVEAMWDRPDFEFGTLIRFERYLEAALMALILRGRGHGAAVVRDLCSLDPSAIYAVWVNLPGD